MPLISIIIATRNAAGTLGRCLDSIRAQTFRDFELLVMDGGSTDGTVDMLRAGGDVVTAWRSEPDTGIYHAWNKALVLATGEWVCFLGGDDWLWDEGALERLAPMLRTAGSRSRVVYSRVRQVDASGAMVEDVGEPWTRAREAFLRYRCLPHPGLMHHRSLFVTHGRFDETFSLAADYEFLLRELKSGEALFVPALSVGMNYGGRTTSPENFHRLLRETKRALAMHGLVPPRLPWVYWTLCAWFYLALYTLAGDRVARRLADAYRYVTLRGPLYSGAGSGSPRVEPPDAGEPRKPRLMVVAPYFYPRIGGVENYAYNIARRLHEQGAYRVSVITSNTDSNTFERGMIDGMTVHRLPAWFRVSNTPVNPLWYWHCRRIFGAENPDIVHVHAPVPFMADVAARAASGIPVVLTYHAGTMIKGRWPIDLLIRVYERILLAALCRRVTALVTVSSGIAEGHLRRFRDKTHIIPPGVDLEQFAPAPLPAPLRTVMFVGRIERHSQWKGIEPLLRAMQRVREKCPRARLEIVGGGDAVEHYARRAAALGIKESVTFCGPQTGGALADAYHRASVVVLPSTSEAESFGMVLIEAMASGRPVIGSNVGGIPQAIDHEENGLLVPPGDAEALAAAILRLLVDPADAQRLADAGVIKARKFAWDVQVSKYRQLFATLAAVGTP